MTEEIQPTDIAIIGIAAHLPGARDFREYWKNLRDGVESVQEFTPSELSAAGVTEAQLRNPNYVKSGVVLADMEHFDPDFFGFSPKEAAILDPQHRHFLECAWEALEDAGHPPEKFDGAVGVFGGCGMGAYFAFNLLSNPRLVESVGLFLLRHTGNDKDFLCTRVSYNLDLRGPSVNVQTACSTSLVAVHTACQNLLSGECDMALAGGVTIELPHRRGYMFQEGEILSPDGHCRAFDERSQGTIFGSGAGIVVLRRLSDAIADNDHVYAVIRGSAINNDGSGKVGYLAPSVDGQAAAVTEALSVADVRSDTIQYIECHGTGTPMGDPIEISALTQAFRETSDAPEATGTCAIGSVKTNIGHLDTAAGVAGLIKVALSLENRQIPPSLNYKAPNPNIEFEKTPFFVNARLSDWVRGETPRRAGVNSLGVGGTNAHVIVEEAPEQAAPARASRPYQLLTLSAKNRAALDEAGRRLARHLRDNPEQSLADVAWTLHGGRRAFGERRVLAASTGEEAAALLEALDTRRVFTHTAPSGKSSTVFMFPGGGAQHPRMGRDLYLAEPVYREHLDRGLAELMSRTGKDLRPLLFADDARLGEVAVVLERPSLQLPAIFIVEYALAKLWMSWGVEPAAMIGHSMGENTAACLAGVMSYSDTLGLVSLRGDLFERVQPGGMLSVPLSAEELQPLLGSELDLASVNSTGLCVASGPVSALDRLARQLLERGVETKRVPIAIAAHSRLLDPILADFGAYLRSIQLSAPKLPFVSNFTGTWITDRDAQDPEYWVRHLRSTIRFADGIKTLCSDRSRVFLEVGPGKTLSSLARQHADLPAGTSCLSSLRHPDERISDVAFFTAVLGRLWGAGVGVDLAQLWTGENRRRVSLPTYAFQRQRYWIEPGTPAAAAESAGPEKLANFDEWFRRPKWTARPLLNETAARAKETWLVFIDDAGIGERVVSSLAQCGHDVITVRESDSYEQVSPAEYFLSPEHGREGYDRLVRDLVASGKVPSGIAHLWMVTADESFRPGSSFFHRNQERGFYSLFFLAQAIGDEGLPGPLRVHVVSNGMQSVDGEALCYPDKATLLGPCKVWPHETTGTTVSSIDVELPGQGGTRKPRFPRFNGKRLLDDIARALTAELAAPAENAIVAVRDGERFVQELEPWKPAEEPQFESRLRERGVYLITGGLGGIGLVTAQFLATRYRARLVLVGRTGLPARNEWDAWLARSAFSNATTRRIQKVRELEQAGAEVLIAPADITDSVAMRAVLRDARSRFGSIDGVFHTAGVLDDGLIQGKTQSSIEEVFTPKVHGTLVLDALLAEEKPAFLVLYSSTSAWIAPAGQVDYVAANAFLDAYAHSRSQSSDTYTVAVNWGVWNEVGMGFEAASRMGQGGSSSAQHQTRVSHPFFDARVEDRSSHITLTARFTPAARWVLDEHRTRQGHALLPGSGYFELIGAALRECGEKSTFEVRDLYFFRPMYVADSETKELRVRLRASDEGYTFDLQTKVELDGGRAGYQTHAQARVLLHAMQTPEPVDLVAIDARCDIARLADPARGVRTKQEEHLRFGPRWRVVQSAHYGRGEALATLALPDAFHSDVESIALHPALIDLATGFAMNLIEGYLESNDLWVPVSYKSARVHGRLPAHVRSWVRNHTANTAGGSFATFDVTITDPRGRVLVEVEEFAIKRLANGEVFAVAPKPSERELEFDEAHGVGSRPLSPAELAFQQNLERGILPIEGQRALERVLAGHAESQIVVSSLDLAALEAQSRALATITTPEGDGAKFARPDLASEYVAARTDIEKTLVGFFEELLGVQSVGVKDSFFDLGGHSLVAVRLFSKIKKAWQVEYPISVLFEAPTIEGCAEMIRSSIGDVAANAADPAIGSTPSTAPRARYAHLVKMHPGEGTHKTPFFLVAGMFGNVLNLRHVAQLVGADRPFYGLQARGLYGDHKPHETFEEMAEAYLAELFTIQPQGPYLLGGFSGGGITAFEMARQLRARGQEVSMLLMLDTPLPKSEPLTARDKAMIHWQRLKRSGHNYIFDWAKGRFRWELAKIQRKLSDAPPDAPHASGQRASEFRSELIESAFRRALTLYDVRHYPGTITLFRPKLDETHVLGPGRVANKVRELVYHDNGWSSVCQRVDVVEMPGDHDSMVLEPNVRVLAARLRERIQDVEERRESTRLAS